MNALGTSAATDTQRGIEEASGLQEQAGKLARQQEMETEIKGLREKISDA